MFKRSFLAIAASLVVFFALSETASAQGGIYLGVKEVLDRADNDKINVGASKGTFDKVQFRIGTRAVDFKKVVVHYENGNKEELDLRERIPAGGRSRWIDLKGNDRRIKSIEFWYDADTKRRGVRSSVSAFGMR